MLAALRDALAVRLRTIGSFEDRVLETPPDGSIPTPYSFVADPVKYRGHLPIEYGMAANESAPGYTTVYLPVVVVAGGNSLREARDALDAYLVTTGPNSVTAALKADPSLGGACDSLEIKGVEDYAPFGTNVGAMILTELIVEGA